jgi:hypothetical protein
MFVVAAPVQCPDLLAAAPRNRRLELVAHLVRSFICSFGRFCVEFCATTAADRYMTALVLISPNG